MTDRLVRPRPESEESLRVQEDSRHDDGQRRAGRVPVRARQSLLEVLRDTLRLTGAKEGCNNGNCGACTVILDGVPVNSCLVLAVEAEGAAHRDRRRARRRTAICIRSRSASWKGRRLQCGICTPGFLVAAKALLDKNPNPERTRDPLQPGQQPLPLHGLRQDREGRAGRREGTAGEMRRCTGTPLDAIVIEIHTSRASTMAHTDELYLGKKEYQVLGRRPVRHDGADKVTGKAIYTADVQLPNMAHGKIVRSPHAHARIKSIDAERGAEDARRVRGRDRGRLPRPGRQDRHHGRGGAGQPGPPGRELPGQGQGPLQGPRRGGRGRGERPPGRGGGGEDQGRVRGAAERHLGARRDEGRRAPAARRPAHRLDGQEGRQADQRRRPPPVREGERRRGLQAGRRRGRARVPHGQRPPGLHRAARRRRDVERGRPPEDLDGDAGLVQLPPAGGRAAADPRLASAWSCPARSAAASAARSPSTWSRSRRSSAASAAGR